VLVTGQVDHAGDRPIILPNPRGSPDVLVQAERRDAGEPGGGGGPASRLELDGVPAGVPVHAEMPSQRQDGGVVVRQSTGGPSDRPASQLRPRGEQRVYLAERAARACPLRTAPDPLAPPQRRRHTEVRCVGGLVHPPAVPYGDDSARGAAGEVRVGLHRHEQAVLLPVHREHSHPRHAEQRTAAGRTNAHPDHTDDPVIHVGVFFDPVAWSLPIVKAPTPQPPAAPRRPAHPALRTCGGRERHTRV
jgi:hypothetical protein